VNPSSYTWLLAAALLLNTAWLLVFQREAFRLYLCPVLADEPPSPPPAPPRSWRERWREAADSLRVHSASALVALASALLLAYALLFLPEVPLVSRPGEIGHPFNGLRFSRDFFVKSRDHWALLIASVTALVSLLLFGAALLAWRGELSETSRHAHAGLLIASLGLLGVGQLGLLGFAPAPRLHLILGIGGAFTWALSYGQYLQDDLLLRSWPRWQEVALLGLALVLTIFARFFALALIPYGVEGDESKWTVEVVEAMFDGVYNSNTEFHIVSVPVSFWAQAPFHAALGPGLIPARITVAFYSVLGSLAVYWLARQLFGPPVAWLAVTLLAVSPFDISASRLANVESHVKLWPPLALALLALAIRRHSLPIYALAGTAIALGLLTYDTVAPLVGVVLVVLAYELWRARRGWPDALCVFGALLVPVAAVTLITGPYLIGRFEYYGVDEQGWSLATALETLRQHLSDLLGSLFITTFPDFLYNRIGPVFSAQLLPWLVLGSVLTLAHAPRRPLLWVGVFGFLFFFPVPVLAGTPFGRAYYAGLPAAYLLMSVAILATFRELERAWGLALKPLLLGLFGLGLLLLIGTNLGIAFNEVVDADDRVARRDLYEAGREEGSPSTLLLFPFVPGNNDPAEQERELILRLGMRPPVAQRVETYPHQLVELSMLAEAVRASAREPFTRTVIVWDAWAQAQQPEREGVLQALLNCYPGLEEQRGRRFVRYTVTRAQIEASSCR
jgi:hypothetical protein